MRAIVVVASRATLSLLLVLAQSPSTLRAASIPALYAPPCPLQCPRPHAIRPQHLRPSPTRARWYEPSGWAPERQHNPSISADLHNHNSDTRRSFERSPRTVEMARVVVTACVSATGACPHSPFLRLVRLDGWTSSLAIRRATQRPPRSCRNAASKLGAQGQSGHRDHVESTERRDL